MRNPKVPDDRGVADHLHRHVGKLERLDRRLPPHDPFYELGLVLEPGIGMAVAQLWQMLLHAAPRCLENPSIGVAPVTPIVTVMSRSPVAQ